MRMNYIVTDYKKSFKKVGMPLTFFSIFTALFSIIDTVWALFISVEAFTIVGILNSLFFLLIKIGQIIGTGTNSYMSRCIGNNNIEKAKNTLLHGLGITILITIIYVLVSIICIKDLMIILGFSNNINIAYDYYFPLIITSLIFVLVEFFASTLQAELNSKTPTTLITIGNIINIIITPVIVFYLNLGIIGLSIGTIIGELIPFTYLFNIYFFKKSTEIEISMKYFKLSYEILLEIFKVSLPNIIDRSLFTIQLGVISLILTSASGSLSVSLYVFYLKILELIESPPRGCSRGVISIAGQLCNKFKINKLKPFYYYSIQITIIISIISMITSLIILFIFQDMILNLIKINIKNINFTLFLTTIIIHMIIIPIPFCSSKLLDGIGKSIHSLILTIIMLLLQIIIVYIFAIILNQYTNTIFYSIIISETFITILYFILTKKLINKEKLKITN